jgi:hypothetical protein
MSRINVEFPAINPFRFPGAHIVIVWLCHFCVASSLRMPPSL